MNACPIMIVVGYILRGEIRSDASVAYLFVNPLSSRKDSITTCMISSLTSK